MLQHTVSCADHSVEKGKFRMHAVRKSFSWENSCRLKNESMGLQSDNGWSRIRFMNLGWLIYEGIQLKATFGCNQEKKESAWKSLPSAWPPLLFQGMDSHTTGLLPRMPSTSFPQTAGKAFFEWGGEESVRQRLRNCRNELRSLRIEQPHHEWTDDCSIDSMSTT